MSDLVLDASLALQWFLVDEADRKYSLSVLSSLSEKQAVVPLLWFYEVGNGLLMAYRRKRIAQDQMDGFLTRLKNLPIQAAPQAPMDVLDLPALAQTHSLTNYDAAYLRLHCGSACPSQRPMPLSAGPPPQQPCQFSSPFVYCRSVAHPCGFCISAQPAALAGCVFCTPVVSTGASRMTFRDRSAGMLSFSCRGSSAFTFQLSTVDC